MVVVLSVYADLCSHSDDLMDLIFENGKPHQANLGAKYAIIVLWAISIDSNIHIPNKP